jgi:hypothetical protein
MFGRALAVCKVKTWRQRAARSNRVVLCRLPFPLNLSTKTSIRADGRPGQDDCLPSSGPQRSLSQQPAGSISCFESSGTSSTPSCRESRPLSWTTAAWILTVWLFTAWLRKHSFTALFARSAGPQTPAIRARRRPFPAARAPRPTARSAGGCIGLTYLALVARQLHVPRRAAAVSSSRAEPVQRKTLKTYQPR